MREKFFCVFRHYLSMMAMPSKQQSLSIHPSGPSVSCSVYPYSPFLGPNHVYKSEFEQKKISMPRSKVNCWIKFGLALPSVLADQCKIEFYNSLLIYNTLSTGICLYMIWTLKPWSIGSRAAAEAENSLLSCNECWLKRMGLLPWSLAQLGRELRYFR